MCYREHVDSINRDAHYLFEMSYLQMNFKIH